MTLVSNNKNKEVLTKILLMEKINDKPGKYGKELMKIKFDSDDDLLLNIKLKLHNMTIIVRSVFQEDSKYYPSIFFRWVFVWTINARIWKD